MRTALLVTTAIVIAVLAAAFWLWTPDLARADLEARYFGPDGRYVDATGVNVHVRDTGPHDAPAIVMLHGLGSSLHTWEGWADGLDDRFRVIRIDLPAHGLTGPDPGRDYSMPRTLAILDSLLDTLGIQSAALVGNSVGGRIAWNYAASRPQRVGALVLIAPDGFESPGYEYGKAPELPAMLGLMRHALPAFMLRPNVEAAYADKTALTDETFKRYYDMMRAPGVRAALVDQMGQVLLEPPVPLLETITAPTLLVWGEKDAMIPVDNAQDYLAALPDARLVTFADLGHVPHEEAPERTLEPVRVFLDDSL